MAIRQNTLSSHNNDKAKALYSIKKQFSPHCGTVQICLTTKRDMNFFLGNLIAGVNIGRMVAMKIISHLSICQKLSRIFSDLRDDNLLSQCLERTTQIQIKPLTKLFGKSVQRIYLFQDMY